VDQVVAPQPPAITKFLLVTSILIRFCVPLCKRVIAAGDDGAQCNVHACIEWLKRANLFVIPLDNEREWYRYNHLFQELLQRRLRAEVGPEQVTELHRAAASSSHSLSHKSSRRLAPANQAASRPVRGSPSPSPAASWKSWRFWASV
jgi:LuxR family maltose regulon positive regulatory protein